MGGTTHVKPTCSKLTPFREVSFLASPPCGLLLTVMLETSTLGGSFSAIWGTMSVKVVDGSTVSRNWPSLLVNRRIIAAFTEWRDCVRRSPKVEFKRSFIEDEE